MEARQKGAGAVDSAAGARKGDPLSADRPLIELSELDGLRLSFGEPLRFLVSPVTGRVHPHYKICGSQPGRSTTSRPNIQGAPRDPRIRGVFSAADGYMLVAADYQCMELRAAGLLLRRPAARRRVRARR